MAFQEDRAAQRGLESTIGRRVLGVECPVRNRTGEVCKECERVKRLWRQDTATSTEDARRRQAKDSYFINIQKRDGEFTSLKIGKKVAKSLKQKLERYKDRTGKSFGFGADSSNTSQSSQENNITYRWTLPLWLIPCFNQDKLLPPQIMEGLRIELTLEDPAVAFESTGTVSAYAVTNAEIHSDAFDIADQFKRKVAEMSARQGLILVHKEYFHSNVGTIAESTSYNFDIKKACSKACRNFTVLRLEANSTGASRQASDSLNAEVYKVSRYQAHVGQDYMPNQPIDVPLDPVTNLPALTGINEAYYDTQFVWDKVNQCWYPNTVTPEQFLGDADVTGANCGMVAFNLNKSHVTDLDGYVLNNSRALVVDIKCAGDAVARKLDTYLEHLRVAKVYTANAEIRD